LKHFHNVGVPRFLRWRGFQGEWITNFLKEDRAMVWQLQHPEAEAKCEINNVQL